MLKKNSDILILKIFSYCDRREVSLSAFERRKSNSQFSVGWRLSERGDWLGRAASSLAQLLNESGARNRCAKIEKKSKPYFFPLFLAISFASRHLALLIIEEKI